MKSETRQFPWSKLLLESAVIVFSILVAFAVDAWWSQRQDRVREREYLQLLASDLQSTLANIRRFGSFADSTSDPALGRLVRAYYEPSTPPADTILVWLNAALGQTVVQPRLGTAEALVSTGDIALIRDDTLRTMIRDYLTDMTFFGSAQQGNWEGYTEQFVALSKLVDLRQAELAVTTAAARDSSALRDPLAPFPAGAIRALPPLRAESIVRDPAIHEVLSLMLAAKSRLRFVRANMRRSSEQLLDRVEAALAE